MTMSARETAELLLLVGRLVQAGGYDGELTPAQWMALRFFMRANAFSCTPSALAEFQATTRGTASQAIKALEAGGYLTRCRSQADGRSISLRPTDKGRAAIARDPFEMLVRAVAALGPPERATVHRALQQVLAGFSREEPHRHFGVCRDCAHLGREGCCATRTAADPRCLLLDAPIDPAEVDCLCVHFASTLGDAGSGMISPAAEGIPT
jgi:DNA-binding MarR family transcriptional regulator